MRVYLVSAFILLKLTDDGPEADREQYLPKCKIF